MNPIQAWLDAALAGATVTLPAGRFDGPLRIERDVVLEGDPADASIIDARGFGPVVRVEPGVQVELRRLTLTGGRNASGRGGGLTPEAGSAVGVVECRFVANRAVFGGAVFAGTQTELTLADCAIISNQACKGGGGVAAIGSGRVTIDRCTFVDNVAGDGGHHIYLMGYGPHRPVVRGERVQMSPCLGRGTSLANVRGFEGRYEWPAEAWPADSLKVPRSPFVKPGAGPRRRGG